MNDRRQQDDDRGKMEEEVRTLLERMEEINEKDLRVYYELKEIHARLRIALNYFINVER
jgi:hypothetical protein